MIKEMQRLVSVIEKNKQVDEKEFDSIKTQEKASDIIKKHLEIMAVELKKTTNSKMIGYDNIIRYILKELK